MNSKAFDLKDIEPALRKFLFETSTPEDGLTVILQHPQLLTDLVDTLFDSLIRHAHQQGNERLVKLFQGRHLLLQAARKTFLNTSSLTDHCHGLDFENIMTALQKWLTTSNLEEEALILQEHPELFSEQMDTFLDFLITQHPHHQIVSTLYTYKILFKELRQCLSGKTEVSQQEMLQILCQVVVYLRSKRTDNLTVLIA